MVACLLTVQSWHGTHFFVVLLLLLGVVMVMLGLALLLLLLLDRASAAAAEDVVPTQPPLGTPVVLSGMLVLWLLGVGW